MTAQDQIECLSILRLAHHGDSDHDQHGVGSELLVDLSDEEGPRHPGHTPRGGKQAQPHPLPGNSEVNCLEI